MELLPLVDSHYIEDYMVHATTHRNLSLSVNPPDLNHVERAVAKSDAGCSPLTLAATLLPFLKLKLIVENLAWRSYEHLYSYLRCLRHGEPGSGRDGGEKRALRQLPGRAGTSLPPAAATDRKQF